MVSILAKVSIMKANEGIRILKNLILKTILTKD